MLSLGDIGELVSRFALGGCPEVTSPPSPGEQGRVWRLETSTGIWALKELLHREPEDAVLLSAKFQEAAVSAGVPAPAVVRSTDGRVVLGLDGRQFRVFAWVDLLPPNPNLDPAEVWASSSLRSICLATPARVLLVPGTQNLLVPRDGINCSVI